MVRLLEHARDTTNPVKLKSSDASLGISEIRSSDACVQQAECQYVHCVESAMVSRISYLHIASHTHCQWNMKLRRLLAYCAICRTKLNSWTFYYQLTLFTDGADSNVLVHLCQCQEVCNRTGTRGLKSLSLIKRHVWRLTGRKVHCFRYCNRSL